MDDPSELLRRLLDEARGGRIEDAAELMAPDVEWYGSVGGLEPGLAHGRDEVRASFEDYRASWDQLTFIDEATISSGSRALGLVRERARGMGSGVEVEQGAAVMITVRDGKIAKIVSYLDLPRAYRDFGIEQADADATEPGKSYVLRDGRIAEVDG
jgi:ketosteroid isomerase-like protein